MVGAIPAAAVLPDVFLAAGAGCLIGALYRMLRAVLGNSRAACFFCDCTALALAALMFRSAAVSAFTSGVMRWYTALPMGLFALWSQRLLRGSSRCLHAALGRPVRAVYGAAARLWRKKQDRIRREKKKSRPKGLKKPSAVLYNSK